MSDYDVIVIGAGPGGYVCAIKAAQLGLKVACVEKKETLGGTCLNVGCIPSKALLHSSHLYHQANHIFDSHGIIMPQKPSIDLSKMMKNKDKIVSDLTKGIDFLFKKNKVDRFFGTASFQDKNTIKISGGKNDGKTLSSKNFVIATGSYPVSLCDIEFDEDIICSSTGALSFKDVPKKLIVIGGGVIGLEMASVWSRLGSEVDVIEYSDRIFSAMDQDISTEAQKIFKKQGINIHLSSKVTAIKKANGGVEIEYESNEESLTLVADKTLISTGRRPYIEGLNLNSIGININARGYIDVNTTFSTNISNIKAIGDVIYGPMLAHKAEEDGVAVAEILCGQHGHIDYNLIPSVIYTHPEIASIGKTEEQLKKDGVSYKKSKFPFAANSRAKSMNETDGFVKILASAGDDDTILGVHIIGCNAGTMINELSVAMTYGASSEDVARICHSHPDFNEAIKEACMFDKNGKHKPIHM